MEVAFPEAERSVRTLNVWGSSLVRVESDIPLNSTFLEVSYVARNREGAFTPALVFSLKLSFGLLQKSVYPAIIKQPLLMHSRERDPFTLMIFWESNSNFLSDKHELTIKFSESERQIVKKIETTHIDDCHFVHKAIVDISHKQAESLQISYFVQSGFSFSKSFQKIFKGRGSREVNVAVTSDNQYGDVFFRHLLSHFVNHFEYIDLHINVGDFVDRAYMIPQWKNYLWLPLGKNFSPYFFVIISNKKKNKKRGISGTWYRAFL